MFSEVRQIETPVGDPVFVFEDAGQWIEQVAAALAERAAEAIADCERFTLALTGGRTPKALYQRLAQPDLQAAADWNAARIFFGDDRSVGPEHPDSNYGMAREAWLAPAGLPPEHVFRMEGEAEDLAAAAGRYADHLAREVAHEAGWPRFDLILLGMGPDGHIASLFPGTEALDQVRESVVANHVPQLDTWRMTFTYPVLNNAREIWMLTTGEAKAERVAEALGVRPGGDALPVGAVRPHAGRRLWLLDAAAASLL